MIVSYYLNFFLVIMDQTHQVRSVTVIVLVFRKLLHTSQLPDLSFSLFVFSPILA